MTKKTTTFEATGLPSGEIWSNPANWNNGVPVDGDSVILSAVGFTNENFDDIPALGLSTLTEQSEDDVVVRGSQLTIGTLVGLANLTGVVAEAADADAPVSVTIGDVATPDLYLRAVGTGALIADQSATDLGEDYLVDEGGKIVLSAAPASSSSFDYLQDRGTFAFESLGGTTTSVFPAVGPLDVLEVPGSVVSRVTIGPTSLVVVTDKGTYAFTQFNYFGGVRGYTASFDQSTGLVAITFNTVDRFQQAVAAAGGRYLWSNPANWTGGVPGNGASVSVSATGYDDLAALTLASLTIDGSASPSVHVIGGSLTVTSLSTTGSGGVAVLDADATDAGAPVAVTVRQVATVGAVLTATGTGADLLDETQDASAKATDYAVALGGLVELSDTPLTTDIFSYTSSGTFAFEKPAGANLALFEGVGVGSAIEVPGGAVTGVAIGTNSVAITTDLGTYAFNALVFTAPILDYATSVDFATVLQAVTFRGADTFEPTVQTSAGQPGYLPGAGYIELLWSNAANWTEGVPVNGDDVLTTYTPLKSEAQAGIDDLTARTLSGLTLAPANTVLVEHRLTIGTLTENADTQLKVISTDPAAPAVLTIAATAGVPYDSEIYAVGAGATVIDRSPTDPVGAAFPGMIYFVVSGGKLELLSAAPATTSKFLFFDPTDEGAGGEGTLAFGAPGTVVAAPLLNIAPNDVLELPGTLVSSVVFGAASLTVTTDAGTVAFTNVTYGNPVTGYTAARDPATGLVAISFTGSDTFEPNVQATSGLFAGYYLWSNAANWSDGVPISGDTVQVNTGGISMDDVPDLSLPVLQLGFSLPDGVSETLDGVTVLANTLTIGTLEATPGQNKPGGVLQAIGDEGVPGGGPATITVDSGAGGIMELEADGVGAHVIDKTTPETGVLTVRDTTVGDDNEAETYQPLFATDTVNLVGPLILGATKPGETIAFHDPGASNPGLLENVAAGDTLEVPGTAALSVTIGASSLAVTTDAGSYDFSNVTYSSVYPIGSYTTAVDSATGLVAIIFAPPDVFEQNVKATTGPLSGYYLWSNPANWSDGVPINGDSVSIADPAVTSYDDVASLSLMNLTLNHSDVEVTGRTLTVQSVAGGELTGASTYFGFLTANALTAGAPVTVTVGAISGTRSTYAADGAGALFLDQSASVAGNSYAADPGATFVFSGPPGADSDLRYSGSGNQSGTFAIARPDPVTTSDITGFGVGSTLELPGATVSAVTFGANSLSVTTDVGTYAFTDIVDGIPVTGYTAAPDPVTGLVAITFTGPDVFEQNAKATSGALAGDYLWSNAANWSNGLPVNGDNVTADGDATGDDYDDIAALRLSSLSLNGSFVTVYGSSLTVGTVAGTSGSTLFAFSPGDGSVGPSTVILGAVTGTGAVYAAHGVGTTLIDQSPTDTGNVYAGSFGGLVELAATLADSSSIDSFIAGKTALEHPATSTSATFKDVAPGDVLELPGTSVASASFGPASFSITTDAGAYAFTNVTYAEMVSGITAAHDASTGLEAITFTGVDTFAPNTEATIGPLSGYYPWSNAANWSEESVPTNALAATLPTGAYTTAIATGESETANAVTIAAGATLVVDGALHIDNDLTVTGALLAYGSVTVGGDFTVAGSGRVVLRSNIVVTGTYHEGDDTTLGPGGSLVASAIDVTAGGRFTLDGGTADGQNFTLSGGVLELASGGFDLPLTSGDYGTIQIDAGTAMKISGAASSDIMVDFAGEAATLTLGDPALFGGVIGGAGNGDAIAFATAGVTIVSYAVGDGGLGMLTLDIADTDTQLRFADGSAYSAGSFVPGAGQDGGTMLSVACFAKGTRILTATGPVMVEALREGDIVQARFAGAAPIRWIGHRQLDCRQHPDPTRVWPVRVAAGAFGPGMPHRDVWLSPDHAVLVDEVLIPIRYLVNGSSVAQVERAEVRYFHVELDQHDVLLAEGLPVESYLDTDNRSNFANSGGQVALHPNFSAWEWEARGCAPLVVVGTVLDAVKQRLNARVVAAPAERRRRPAEW